MGTTFYTSSPAKDVTSTSATGNFAITSQNHHFNSSLNSVPKRLGKRRFDGSGISAIADRKLQFQHPHPHPHNMIKKKQKNQSSMILGERLNVNRLIETLDKEKLQKLVLNLINERPEITNSVIELSPKILFIDAINELNSKLKLVYNNLPYKVSVSSDYAYLRVKPFIDEFFQSLSDYTLNFLPPIEQDLLIPINFLKKFLLEVFHELPKFQSIEFKYFHKVTVEKLNKILENLITLFISNKIQNMLIIVNENWLDEFCKINELNNNNFERIYDLLKDEIDNFENLSYQDQQQNNTAMNDNSNANKLSGIENLLNFAYNNTTVNNI